jgi:hypothetical protein
MAPSCKKLTRRQALAQAVRLTIVAGTPAALAACAPRGADLRCSAGLSETDLSQRKRAGYLETSPWPGRTCGDCESYHARLSDWVCGACAVVKGPIDPSGMCDAWQKRTS